jgi:transcriptional regulator with XRE-family HTH domain
LVDIEQLKAEIGEKLKAAREAKRMSQEELANRLGLSKVGYGALERGKNLIGLQHLISLTFILEKPVTYFLPRYAISEDELNDLSHDPLWQELASLWPDLTAEDVDAFMVLIRIAAARRRGEE